MAEVIKTALLHGVDLRAQRAGSVPLLCFAVQKLRNADNPDRDIWEGLVRETGGELDLPERAIAALLEPR